LRRIVINFHDAPVWQARKLGLACLVLGTVLSGVCAWYGWQAFSELSRWNAELAGLRQVSVASASQSTEGNMEINTELESANQIVSRLNTPWADLFAALETVHSDDAVLLGAEPDPVSRQIRLTGEARNTDSMLEFVRQLRASKVLGDAYVMSHAVNQQDMQRPIRFSVASHWLDLPSKSVEAAGSETGEGGVETGVSPDAASPPENGNQDKAPAVSLGASS
jgi:Tfp pilus assembly protein PilN